jgi:hypothetical protein
VLFALIVVGLVVFGLVTGRWWAVLAALPFGVVMGLLSDPWETTQFHCGVVFTQLGAAGIGLGVVLRTLARLVPWVRPRPSAGG